MLEWSNRYECIYSFSSFLGPLYWALWAFSSSFKKQSTYQRHTTFGSRKSKIWASGIYDFLFIFVFTVNMSKNTLTNMYGSFKPLPVPLNSMLFNAANPTHYLTLDGSFESLPLPLNSMLLPVATGSIKKA
jgi:hypothetical protein